MSEGPTRLIHEDPLVARLLAASDAEEPSGEQLDKALALATDAAAASRWSLFGRIGLGRRVAIGLAVVGVTAVGFNEMRGEPNTREVAAPVPVVTTVLPTAAPIQDPGEPAAKTVSVDDLADAPATNEPAKKPIVVRNTGARSTPSPAEAPVVAPHGGRDSDPSSAGATFREELALVSSARAALESGDTAACMRALDGYDARFPSGIFAQEIEVIRIEVLAASGQGARSKTLAERFLAANPKSPYADRVRSSLERTRN